MSFFILKLSLLGRIKWVFIIPDFFLSLSLPFLFILFLSLSTAMGVNFFYLLIKCFGVEVENVRRKKNRKFFAPTRILSANKKKKKEGIIIFFCLRVPGTKFKCPPCRGSRRSDAKKTFFITFSYLRSTHTFFFKFHFLFAAGSESLLKISKCNKSVIVTHLNGLLNIITFVFFLFSFEAK